MIYINTPDGNNTGQCITAISAFQVRTQECTGELDQLWTQIPSSSSGSSQWVNYLTGRCLKVPLTYSETNADQVIFGDCNPDDKSQDFATGTTVNTLVWKRTQQAIVAHTHQVHLLLLSIGRGLRAAPFFLALFGKPSAAYTQLKSCIGPCKDADEQVCAFRDSGVEWCNAGNKKTSTDKERIFNDLVCCSLTIGAWFQDVLIAQTGHTAVKCACECCFRSICCAPTLKSSLSTTGWRWALVQFA